MAGFSVTKGSVVEVSSDEPGFHGAWYVATVVDVLEGSPTKRRSSSKKKKKTGYLVKYDTLFQEENLDEQLTEVVEPSFVRPLPPVTVEDGDGGDFEVNDVIDAEHRDGWWTGVIKKVIIDDDGHENKKFVVAFENPPEEFEFQKSQLRLHVDWLHGRWLVPPKETGEQAESNTGFTTPLKGTLPTNLENQTKVPTTKKRGRSQKKIESNGEMVGKVDASGTNSVEEASRGKRSQSSTGSKGHKKVKVPVMETSGSQAINQNSVIVDQEMITTEICELEDGKSQQKKPRGRPAKLQVTTPNGVQQEKQKAWKRDSSAFHEEPIDLDDQPLCVWYRGLQNPSVLKRSTCCSPPNNRDEPNGALNQAIVNNGGIVEPKGALNQANVNNGGTNEPNGAPNQAIVNNGGTDEPNGALNQAIVNNGGTIEPKGAVNQTIVNNGGTDEPSGVPIVNNGGTATDYQPEWPFIKQSPVWAAIESLESYKKLPQKPHFSPLKEIKEESREGLAIAHIVTFANVFQRISYLQLTESNEIIKTSLETLVELETHGFDVKHVRARLNELLDWKSKVGQHKDKLKTFEEQVEKCKVEKCEVDEKMKQLKVKIKELEEEMVENVEMMKVKDEEIMNLQSNSDLVSNDIMDWELAFEKLKAAPF